MHLQLSILFLTANALAAVSSEESQFSINNNKAIQLVNERFISFSVDPAVFFTKLPHRDILFKLITHLSPAYLRVAGSSTQFLDFTTDERKATKIISNESTSLTFSPAMWWALNEWMQKTNFTPIFGINDGPLNPNEKWDPKRILPLLDMTARMNVNCWWQIGFDCSHQGFEVYKENLKAFRQLLDAYPTKKDKWQLVGSDLSKCTPTDHSEILRMYLADLDQVDAVIWEEDESIVSNFLSGGVMEKLLGFHQATVPIWLSTPKSQHPIGFEDGINWAIELGEAARKGFGVIFREPRLQEYYSTTTAYWVTVLHKYLMGRNVLDIKSTSFTNSDARIYAHCARDQNSFSVRGALTLMLINNGTTEHKAAFRLPTQIKSVEVRSYLLTTKENTTDTYLNNEKLTLDSFKLLPKLRRAKILTHLMLTAPAKSIAFFVLPGAKIPICIDNEDDTALILEEIDRIQAVDFADTGKSSDGLLSRINVPRVSVSLADLHRKLVEEFKTDAALVPKLKLKSNIQPKDDWKQLSDKIQLKTFQNGETNNKNPILGMKNLNFLLESNKVDKKPSEKIIKSMDFKNILKSDKMDTSPLISNLQRHTNKQKINDVALDLSSSEVFKILENRAKSKIEKKMGFTDFEFDLDAMLERALKNKFKRDINLKLLDEKYTEQEAKKQHKLLPTLVKTKKQKEDKVIDDSSEIEGLPDMSKIIPGFEKSKPKSLSKTISETSIFGNKKLPKLEFFGGEKLDLQGLLSLLGNKASTTESSVDSESESDLDIDTKPTTQRPTMRTTTKMSFMRKPDLYSNHDLDQQFHELEDDLNGASFFDHFGDSISISPKQSEDRKDLGAGWDFNDAFLDNEFIINDDDVPSAIKKLENYFNQGSKSRMNDEYFEPAFDSFEHFGRFKRGIRDFIQRMKQRSNNQLHVFRRPRSNPEIESKDEDVNLGASSNKIIKEYKSKLDWEDWRPEDMLKLPQLHSMYNVDERPDQISFKDIPQSRSSLGLKKAERINIRKARRVADGIDSVENAIESFFNTIEKDTKFIKPLLDKEQGEYTLVLPTHEKLSLKQEENGDTEIVLHRDAARMSVQTQTQLEDVKHKDKDNQVDDSTCPATDLYPGLDLEILKSAFKHDEHDASTNDGNAEIKNEGYDDIKHSVPEKRVNRSEYVQKIPLKSKSSNDTKGIVQETVGKYNLGFVSNIVNSFSTFMKKLHNKMDTIFHAVE